MRIKFLFLPLLCFLLCQCKNKNENSVSEGVFDTVEGKGSVKGKNSEGETKSNVTSSVAPKFNSDSAFKYVSDQVAFGPRVPNSKSHVACSHYLENSLKRFGFKTYRQEFNAIAYNGTSLNSFNIIGSFNPEITKRILLAAHWDSRPYADRDPDESKWNTPVDGANDGASGVGILLELARVLQNSDISPKVGVDVIFFDSEDYGEPAFYKGEGKAESWCLGSQYWAKNKHISSYYAYYGILLDMVGAKNATFYKEGESMTFAPSVVHNVWMVANRAGFGDYFVNDYCSPIIDDHAFVNRIAGIPMIDIIHYNEENENQFFGDYWHTHNDNMDAVDKETLNAVGQTLLEVLYSEKK